MKAMKEQGVEIVEVDKALFEEAVKPVVDKFLADASEDQKALYDLLTKTRETISGRKYVMYEKRLCGVVIPTITPMNEDGSIDDASLANFTRYLLGAGVNACIPTGQMARACS